MRTHWCIVQQICCADYMTCIERTWRCGLDPSETIHIMDFTHRLVLNNNNKEVIHNVSEAGSVRILRLKIWLRPILSDHTNKATLCLWPKVTLPNGAQLKKCYCILSLRMWSDPIPTNQCLIKFYYHETPNKSPKVHDSKCNVPSSYAHVTELWDQLTRNRWCLWTRQWRF